MKTETLTAGDLNETSIGLTLTLTLPDGAPVTGGLTDIQEVTCKCPGTDCQTYVVLFLGGSIYYAHPAAPIELQLTPTQLEAHADEQRALTLAAKAEKKEASRVESAFSKELGTYGTTGHATGVLITLLIATALYVGGFFYGLTATAYSSHTVLAVVMMIAAIALLYRVLTFARTVRTWKI